jgi:hypothetical protein
MVNKAPDLGNENGECKGSSGRYVRPSIRMVLARTFPMFKWTDMDHMFEKAFSLLNCFDFFTVLNFGHSSAWFVCGHFVQ